MKTWIGRFVLLAVFGLVGCGGGGNGDPSDTPEVGNDTEGGGASGDTGTSPGPQTGEFIDARVKGLPYWTASNGFGTTDENGGFSFLPGEMVVFYIGNQVLLYTDAEQVTTPIDTLSAEVATAGGGRHPHEAINILRFLQSVDSTPDDPALITVPVEVADININLDLNFVQDTLDFEAQVQGLFAPEGALHGLPPVELVSYADAAKHLRNSLVNLENNEVDLSGTWFDISGLGSRFGAIHPLKANLVWEIERDRVTVSGTELHTRDAGGGDVDVFTTPVPVVEADILEGSAAVDTIMGQVPGWAYHGPDGIRAFLEELAAEFEGEDGLEIAVHNGENFVTWEISEDIPLFENNCTSALCSLAELRSTTNDWDAECVGSFDERSECSSSDEDYESRVVFYSEVTWADRLGGDRLIRMKRDFWRPNTVEAFTEIGYFYSILDHKEAQEAAVDLTGEWELTHIGSDPRNPTKVTITFGDDNVSDPSLVQFTCEKGFKECGWTELNQRQNGASLIHVRGTNVVNWATDNGFYTMRRPN